MTLLRALGVFEPWGLAAPSRVLNRENHAFPKGLYPWLHEHSA